MTMLTPVAYASGYIEVWNPPEARAFAPHRVDAAHRPTVRRHVVTHRVRLHTHAVHASAPGLVAKETGVQKTEPAVEPDMSEIPRQITPEGNVLRVTTRADTVMVTR